MYIAHLAEGSEGLLPPGGSEGLLPFLDLCLRLQA